MFKSRTLKTAAVSVALTAALAACAAEPDEDAGTDADTGDGGTDTGEEDDEAAGEEGGEEGGDLVIGVNSDLNSLDPHTSNDVPSGQMQTQIYETLAKFDEDMELQPYLAESWEDVEEDVWRFNLVEGVTFHDGSEFNAEVVAANVERILDEEIGSPRAILFDVIEEVNVVDDYTVEFRTEVPFAPLPSHFAHYAASMISKESIEGDYEAMEEGAQPGEYINDHPYGTGYFEFEEWVSGDYSRAVNFEDYWGENAKVDSVELRVMPESSSRIGELTTGGIHIGDPLEATDINRIEGTDDVGYFMTEGASISYLGFNMQKEPFDDARVRRALSLALDTGSMVDSILEGTGERANGPINQTQFGYTEDIPVVEQNLEEARELLAEAGYEDGFETTLWTNDSAEREQIAQVAQANFEEIGVDVNIEVVEWGAYLDATGAGEHDMFILGLSLGTGDADYPMHMLFHSENVGSTGNRSFMEDETFDDILYQARTEQDEDQRAELYKEAVEYLQEEAPMAFLYHPAQIMGVHDSVQGYWADGSGLYQLQDVTIN
ncbi:glutathione ABC transporter substrate-binding protein [Alteribacter natronophilus]|uniref:glutathione ABC transporter substrate-binding protein n=1 Tax=Alteribacter natronophilus TaxID=2583810 RepID=UPI00110E8763|nr:glutathione ABC transporter substrate-binding protein [Alteribacter natronophilus]TMW70461.1 glutathione ABC transporter substrate-binding protein [Alteribacter natronophilus]